jgi:hypothetical protein
MIAGHCWGQRRPTVKKPANNDRLPGPALRSACGGGCPSCHPPAARNSGGETLGFEDGPIWSSLHFYAFAHTSSRFHPHNRHCCYWASVPASSSPVAGPGDCFFALPCRPLNDPHRATHRVPLANTPRSILNPRSSTYIARLHDIDSGPAHLLPARRQSRSNEPTTAVPAAAADRHLLVSAR